VGGAAGIQNLKMASRADKHEAIAEAEGSDSKPGIVKRSHFNLGSQSLFGWNLSDVDKWSKMDPSQLEEELKKKFHLLDFPRDEVMEDIGTWRQLSNQQKKKLLRQEKERGRQWGLQSYIPRWIQRYSQAKAEAQQKQSELEEVSQDSL